MLLVHILLLSFHLAFIVIPILNGWFYSSRLVLAGWDGDEESAGDVTMANVEMSRSQDDGNDDGKEQV